MESVELQSLFQQAFCIAIEQCLGPGHVPVICKQKLQGGYISHVDFVCHGNKFTLYNVATIELLEFLSNELLFDDSPTQETLADISKELSNLIIGVAKTNATENGLTFGISPPRFLSAGIFRAPFNTYCSFEFQTPENRCSLFWIRH